MLGLFAVGYAAMSRHVADAGAFYTYVARGLGKIPAVGTAFLALISYNAMQLGIYGLFGVATAAFASDKLGITMEWYWWCLIAGAVIAVLGVLRVDLNAKVLAVALTLEVIIVATFDFAILADPGPQGLTLTGFDPSVATGLGVRRRAGVLRRLVRGLRVRGASTARRPRTRSARWRKATFIGVGLIAVFYALSSWLLAASVGPDTMVNPEKLVEAGFTTPDGKAPDPTTVLFGAGDARLGAFWTDAATLLFCTSLFAALLAFHNNVARYFFALGREGVLPRAFASVQSSTGAPWVGSMVQTLLALVVVGWFALADKDPVLQLFTWLTNLGALGVLALMALTSFAVVAFFRRAPVPDLGQGRTLVAPLIAGVLLVAAVIIGLAELQRADHRRHRRAHRRHDDRAADHPVRRRRAGARGGGGDQERPPGRIRPDR